MGHSMLLQEEKRQKKKKKKFDPHHGTFDPPSGTLDKKENSSVSHKLTAPREHDKL